MFRQIPLAPRWAMTIFSAATALKHSAELAKIMPLISAVSFMFIVAP